MIFRGTGKITVETEDHKILNCWAKLEAYGHLEEVYYLDNCGYDNIVIDYDPEILDIENDEVFVTPADVKTIINCDDIDWEIYADDDTLYDTLEEVKGVA